MYISLVKISSAAIDQRLTPQTASEVEIYVHGFMEESFRDMEGSDHHLEII